ncbi:MAG: hypothetical protein JWO20_612 [Candidatus Angelobacter sp.]|jgi:hypothetical protein|nr:hypothetical protein [Candidatus Angelobacter sp.]
MFLTTAALGQSGPEDPIIANPNRPTVADPADITQFGVAEIEYGFTVAKSNQSLDGLLKFAFAKNLELRIETNTFQRDANQHVLGVGDTGIGIQWRIVHQKKYFPTFSVSYAAKAPTAPDTLGAGDYGHEARVLMSKDFGKSHFDANLSYFFLGRSGAPGFDHSFLPALAWSHPLKGKWATTAEIWGTTHQNASTGGTTSLLAAATYQLKPRLVLDSGMNFGLRGDIPRAAFFVGVTYSIFDLYHPSRR